MFRYIDKDYDVDVLNSKVSSDLSGFIKESEDFYFSQVEEACDRIMNKRVVLLSGPSASGKTTTAHKIRDRLIERGKIAHVVSLDDFYLDRDLIPTIKGEKNAEVIEALDLVQIERVMHAVVDCEEVWLPSYDFSTGQRRDNSRKVSLGKDGIVIFEGIHALNPRILGHADERYRFGIYISPHSGFTKSGELFMTRRETRFIRRLVRDSWSRATFPEETFSVWRTVCEGEDKYIRPCANIADMHINSTHAYEPCLIGKKATELLKQIIPGSAYYGKASEMIKELGFFSNINVSLLPENSLLHEFVG